MTEALNKLVSAASTFKNKEILVTVTEKETEQIIRPLLDAGYAVDYASTPLIQLNIQTVVYQGVKIHLNIV